MNDDIIHVGCLAHARRYYADALEVLNDKGSPGALKIKEGIVWCDKLFLLDAKCHELSTAEERTEFRKKTMRKVFEGFFAWAEEESQKQLPKGLYLKALNYTINQREPLMNTLLDERLEVSNNRSERAIKPFVMGRKNWLFRYIA